MDFILQTYVPHQRLYQGFLNGDTGLRHIRSDLEIEGPPHPPPLCEGTDVVELEQQRVLKETRSKEAEIMKLKEKTEAQMMAKLQASLNDLPPEGNMSRQVNHFLWFIGDYSPKFILFSIIKYCNVRCSKAALKMKIF